MDVREPRQPTYQPHRTIEAASAEGHGVWQCLRCSMYFAGVVPWFGEYLDPFRGLCAECVRVVTGVDDRVVVLRDPYFAVRSGRER